LEAGVDVARMNMSHGDYSVHDNTYEKCPQGRGPAEQAGGHHG
jgi:pyruvate kinase